MTLPLPIRQIRMARQDERDVAIVAASGAFSRGKRRQSEKNERCMKFGLFYQLPCATTQDATTRYEVEASFLNYFQAISYQAQLGAREDSPVYAYLHDIRKRAEAVCWEDIETMALYGAPATCIRKMAEVHAQCRMDQLICWFNPGGLVPHRNVMASMRRFAAEVMPAVRELEGNTQ